MAHDNGLAVRDEAQSLTVAQAEAGYAALAHVLGSGDLSQLTNEERVGHYVSLCRSLGLNELSRPFDWVYFKGGEGEAEKLALYPNQSCAAQLRRQHHMRIQITRREVVGDLFVCEATATTPDGREDVSSKYVPLTNKWGPLKGNILANAMMKAETGAKRRVTLSMVGLASPPDADEATAWKHVTVDGRGRVLENPSDEQRALAADPRMARALGEPVFEDMPVPDSGHVSQAVRPDEIERPARPAGERPDFMASAFAFAGEADRDNHEAEYARIVGMMVSRNHPRADDLKSRNPADMKDGELKAAVSSLQRWEQSLAPQAEPDATNADAEDGQ